MYNDNDTSWVRSVEVGDTAISVDYHHISKRAFIRIIRKKPLDNECVALSPDELELLISLLQR